MVKAGELGVFFLLLFRVFELGVWEVGHSSLMILFL
jgi:hypothetical protein